MDRVISAIIFAIACSSFTISAWADISEATLTRHGPEVYQPAPLSDVQVFVYKPDFKYRVIGVIEARGMAGGNATLSDLFNLDKWLDTSEPGEKEDIALAMKALKQEAANAGATGVIIIQSRQVRVSQNATERQIKAMAIRTIPIVENSSTPQTLSISPTTVSGKDSFFRITLPSGWTQIALPNPSLQLSARKPAADAYLTISSVNSVDIQDWQVFAESLRTKLVNNLSQSASSEVQKIRVNGFDALRVDISGVLKNGTKVHFLGTLIKTDKNLVWLLSWTPESKFAAIRTEFEQLANAMQF